MQFARTLAKSIDSMRQAIPSYEPGFKTGSVGDFQVFIEGDPVLAEVFCTVHGAVCRTDESLFHFFQLFPLLFLQGSDPHTAGNHPFDIQGRFSRGRLFPHENIPFDGLPQRFTIVATLFE